MKGMAGFRSPEQAQLHATADGHRFYHSNKLAALPDCQQIVARLSNSLDKDLESGNVPFSR
jgi:hypothetical protein